MPGLTKQKRVRPDIFFHDLVPAARIEAFRLLKKRSGKRVRIVVLLAAVCPQPTNCHLLYLHNNVCNRGISVYRILKRHNYLSIYV